MADYKIQNPLWGWKEKLEQVSGKNYTGHKFKFPTGSGSGDSGSGSTTIVATAGMNYKGNVPSYSALPKTSLTVGDMYNIATDDPANNIKAGDNVAWTGSNWDNVSGTIDTTKYVEKKPGKDLSSNDFSNTYKTKIDNMDTMVAIPIPAIDAMYV